MVIHEKAYTADDLWELSKQPGYEEKFLELIDGEIEELSPSSGKSGVIGLRIGRFLNNMLTTLDLGMLVEQTQVLNCRPKMSSAQTPVTSLSGGIRSILSATS